MDPINAINHEFTRIVVTKWSDADRGVVVGGSKAKDEGPPRVHPANEAGSWWLVVCSWWLAVRRRASLSW
jgi:hypothetical protein